MAIETHQMDLSKVERAVIDGATDGFAALYTHQGRLVGRHTWRPTPANRSRC